MQSTKSSRIIIVVTFIVLLAVAAVILVSHTHKKVPVAKEQRTFRNDDLHYTFEYPADDGKRIYKQTSLGDSSIMIDAGVAKKPGLYFHNIFSVTVVPIGSERDNAPTTAELEAENRQRPQMHYVPVVINKAGATAALCYYNGPDEVGKVLNCRYEYKGLAYWLGAENFSSESTKEQFAGTGGDILPVSESIVRSFAFLP